ncbi:hypothetical protein BH23CHL7_BH23CHL7_06670 [soil metagenome]
MVEADAGGRTTDARATVLPSVTMAICSRNRPGLVQDAVTSVLSGAALPAELLIIDQSDVANEHLRQLRHRRVDIRYLHSSTRGLSTSRNVAVANARNETIVFTDDDVLVTPAWLGTIVAALRDAGPRAVVTGRVLAGDPEHGDAFAPSLHPSTVRRVYEGRIEKDPLATFNFAMTRAAHRNAGGFDSRLGPGTTYPAAEDNDFGYRLLEAGWKIVFEPEAVVYHRAWRRGDDYVALGYSYGRGQGAFYAKHLALSDPYMLRRGGRMLFDHARRLPKAAVCKHQTRLMRELAWIAGFLSGMLEWLVTRRRLRATRQPQDLAAKATYET